MAEGTPITNGEPNLLDPQGINEFEENFPELNNETEPQELNDDLMANSEISNQTYTSNEPTTTNMMGDNQAIQEWKEKRAKEIEERDAKDAEAKKKLQDAAIKHVDEFYESYNNKKEQQLKQVREEAEKFLKERDEFFNQENTTTWDRALQLINVDDADIVGGRDRSKFKEILLKLKGNANAPGA